MTSEPLPIDQDPLRALTEIIEAHDLYLHRHGTVPASKATAHSILHALRNRGLVLSLDAARAQGRAEALDVVLAALTDENEVAHGEAIRGGDYLDPKSHEKVGRCAYCDDKWPCRTQRGIDRLLAAIKENQP